MTQEEFDNFIRESIEKIMEEDNFETYEKVKFSRRHKKQMKILFKMVKQRENKAFRRIRKLKRNTIKKRKKVKKLKHINDIK